MAKVTYNTTGSGYLSNTDIDANFAATATALENTLSRDGTSPNTMGADLDMNSNEILNLAQGSAPSSAARLKDITDAATITTTTAALTTYTPAGTGAVDRTVKGKLDDWVSVKDFGATGDGTTDDSAAIALAEAASDCIVFDSSTYYLGTSVWQPTASKTYIFQNTTLKSGVTNGRAIEIGMDTKWVGHVIVDCDNKAGSTAVRFGPDSGGVAQPSWNCHIQSIEPKNFKTGGIELYSDSNSGVYNNHIGQIIIDTGEGFGVQFYTTTGIAKVNTNKIDLLNCWGITGTGVIVNGADGNTIGHLSSESNTVMNLQVTKTQGLFILGGTLENSVDSTKNVTIADYPDVVGVYCAASIDTFSDVNYTANYSRSVVFMNKQYFNIFGRGQAERLDIGPLGAADDDKSVTDKLRVSGGQYTYRLSSGSPYYYFTAPSVGSGNETGWIFRNATSTNRFLIRNDCDVGFGATTANTNTPSGATAEQLAVYDASGTLLGYVPIYGSPW